MPINQAIEELIQKVLDGSASPQETARLRELTASDESVREELKSQKETAELLSRMTPLEAPPDLHRRVMESLPAAPPARGTVSPPRHGPGGRFPPYLYAAAAGLAVGIVLGPLMLRWLAPLGPVDPSAMMGALAPADRATPAELLDEARVDLTDGPLVARLLRRAGGCALTLEQERGRSLRFAVQFDPQALAVSGITPAIARGEEQTQVTVAAGTVYGELADLQRVTIDFDRLNDARSEIRLSVGLTGGEPAGLILVVPPE